MEILQIAGSGPAGLSAALTAVKNGKRAAVFDRGPDAGSRFHGDFQGLENWTSDTDVLDELANIGVKPTFAHTPFRELVVYDHKEREYVLRSQRPIAYLVRRGPDPDSLDQALKTQAVEAGVELRFNTP